MADTRSQSTLDALADAETFRRIAYELMRDVRPGDSWAECLADTVDDLRIASHGAAVWLDPRTAFRSAFRAVPGLR